MFPWAPVVRGRDALDINCIIASNAATAGGAITEVCARSHEACMRANHCREWFRGAPGAGRWAKITACAHQSAARYS